jgi:hypothetical protein
MNILTKSMELSRGNNKMPRRNEVKLIHFTSLVVDANRLHPIANFDSIYLDRLGEKTAGYSTQLAGLKTRVWPTTHRIC